MTCFTVTPFLFYFLLQVTRPVSPPEERERERLCWSILDKRAHLHENYFNIHIFSNLNSFSFKYYYVIIIFFAPYFIFIFIFSVPVFLFSAPYSLPIVYFVLYCFVLLALLVLIRKSRFVFLHYFHDSKAHFPSYCKLS